VDSEPIVKPGVMVHLSKQRHEALLESEIVHFARALQPHPITVQQILGHRDADTLREFLLVELPIRFARRLLLVEALPGWRRIPNLRVVCSLYRDAFRRLRMIPETDPERFRLTLQHIKRRHTNMLMHVVKGVRAMKKTEEVSDEVISTFLNDFLTARVGSDLLTSQYLAITRPAGPTSVIDPHCDPVAVVRSSASDACRLCKFHYGFTPPVDIVDAGNLRFPFIPQYLNYITFELIKNSLRAVAEKYGSFEASCEYPIRVVVCGDETTVVIRVSDAGGGIPPSALDKVWSYLYTTAKPQDEDHASSSECESDGGQVAPMAGFGCGLPLSRNYASYVGGRLELSSMPLYGTDAYLYLNRLGDAKEGIIEAPLPSRGLLSRVR